MPRKAHENPKVFVKPGGTGRVQSHPLRHEKRLGFCRGVFHNDGGIRNGSPLVEDCRKKRDPAHGGASPSLTPFFTHPVRNQRLTGSHPTTGFRRDRLQPPRQDSSCSARERTNGVQKKERCRETGLDGEAIRIPTDVKSQLHSIGCSRKSFTSSTMFFPTRGASSMPTTRRSSPTSPISPDAT